MSLRSRPGHGSVFGITVPLGERAAILPPPKARMQGPDRVAGSVIMCVENEPAVLSAIQALLNDWGCEVLAMRADNEIGDDAFHEIEEELDWLEMADGTQG